MPLPPHIKNNLPSTGEFNEYPVDILGIDTFLRITKQVSGVFQLALFAHQEGSPDATKVWEAIAPSESDLDFAFDRMIIRKD